MKTTRTTPKTTSTPTQTTRVAPLLDAMTITSAKLAETEAVAKVVVRRKLGFTPRVKCNGVEQTTDVVVGKKWRLGRVIGVGRTTKIYSATNIHNGYRAAVKVLAACGNAATSEERDAEERAIKQSIRESYVASAVHHRGVVRVLGDGATDDGRMFIVMERVRGVTLESASSAHASKETNRRAHVLWVCGVACEVLHILASAHERGISHRNLTARRVVLTNEGVRLLGFGRAAGGSWGRALEASTKGLVSEATSWGTPTLLSRRDATDEHEAATRQVLCGPALDLHDVGRMIEDLCGSELADDAPAVAYVVDRALRQGASAGGSYASAEAMVVALDSAMRATSASAEPVVQAEGDRSTNETDPKNDFSSTTIAMMTVAMDAPWKKQTTPSRPQAVRAPLPSSPTLARPSAPTRRLVTKRSRLTRDFLLPAVLAFVASVVVIASAQAAPASLRQNVTKVVNSAW